MSLIEQGHGNHMHIVDEDTGRIVGARYKRKKEIFRLYVAPGQPAQDEGRPLSRSSGRKSLSYTPSSEISQEEAREMFTPDVSGFSPKMAKLITESRERNNGKNR